MRMRYVVALRYLGGDFCGFQVQPGKRTVQGCLNDAFYTYRYYSVNGKECPALYFDPLIIVGGDRMK